MPYRIRKGRSCRNHQRSEKGIGINRRIGKVHVPETGIFPRKITESISTSAVHLQPLSEQFPKQSLSKKENLCLLKQRIQNLQSQIASIQNRISQFSKGEQVLANKRKSIKASVDDNKCTGCGICADNCNRNAIMVNSVAVIDPARCTGCGICVEGCPNDALSLKLFTT